MRRRNCYCLAQRRDRSSRCRRRWMSASCCWSAFSGSATLRMFRRIQCSTPTPRHVVLPACCYFLSSQQCHKLRAELAYSWGRLCHYASSHPGHLCTECLARNCLGTIGSIRTELPQPKSLKASLEDGTPGASFPVRRVCCRPAASAAQTW